MRSNLSLKKNTVVTAATGHVQGIIHKIIINATKTIKAIIQIIKKAPINAFSAK